MTPPTAPPTTTPRSPSPSSTTSSPIWASRTPSPSPPRTSSTSPPQSSTEPQPSYRHIPGSAIPALKRTHYTSGYRSGISAGTDDPLIAQKGFDDGFPLGARLAVVVGWLVEAVGEVCREQGGVGTGTGMMEAARRELSLGALVGEMEKMGVVGGGGDVVGRHGEGDGDGKWVERLPSVNKWSKFVEERGGRARPG